MILNGIPGNNEITSNGTIGDESYNTLDEFLNAKGISGFPEPLARKEDIASVDGCLFASKGQLQDGRRPSDITYYVDQCIAGSLHDYVLIGLDRTATATTPSFHYYTVDDQLAVFVKEDFEPQSNILCQIDNTRQNTRDKINAIMRKVMELKDAILVTNQNSKWPDGNKTLIVVVDKFSRSQVGWLDRSRKNG